MQASIVLLVVVHTVFANIISTRGGLSADGNERNVTDTSKSATKEIPILNEMSTTKLEIKRRAHKSHRSTSSSSGEDGTASHSSESLGTGDSDTDSDSEEKNQEKTLHGRGWRKWHRKCTPCPGDMEKKWRDPTISWICGGYQRARRSFKSACMMHYRNCQDGTMFVKLHNQKCKDDMPGVPKGKHFFYDYKVVLSEQDSSSVVSADDSPSENSSDSDYEF